MVFRDRRPSRHRAADNRQADAAPAHELALFPATSPDADTFDSGATAELTGKLRATQVFQLRLPALRIEQLRRLAESRGVAPTALVANWVLERLDEAEPGVLAPAPRRELNPARPGSMHVAAPARPASPPPLSAEVTISMEQATVLLDPFSVTEQRPAPDSPAEPGRSADPTDSASSAGPTSSPELLSSAEPASSPELLSSAEPASSATLVGSAELVGSSELVGSTERDSADGCTEPIGTAEPAASGKTPGAAEPAEPGDANEEVAAFYPLEHLTPVGELTSVNPLSAESASVFGTDQAPVIPLLRGTPAHASQAQSKSKSKGPRHRAPEPVTSLHTRRKW
jgi:hypothetical protein